jgi:hypothetical protein
MADTLFNFMALLGALCVVAAAAAVVALVIEKFWINT